MYKFVNTDLHDYKIFFDEEEIGVLLLTVNPTNIFIRQIRIKEEFRRKGHAYQIVKTLIEKSPKPICYCISTHSQSAIEFWEKIRQIYRKSCIHIKGELYEIRD